MSILPQEHEESKFLANTKNELSFDKNDFGQLGAIISNIDQNFMMSYDSLLDVLGKAPNNLSLEQTIDWYTNQLIHNKSKETIFNDMNSWDATKYMQYEHQRSFAKAYFVPLLQKVFDFCDQEGYSLMAQAMRYNIKDESGERPISVNGTEYDNSGYNDPNIIKGEEYKGEPHHARRAYEYLGLAREYGKTITDKRNAGMVVFNHLIGKLLEDNTQRGSFMKMGVVAAAEKIIPEEFIFMKEARDRLFPGLTPKEKHYIDDHIKHDVEYHFQDILQGFDNMNLTDEQVQFTKDGIHLFYMGRSYMYSSFIQQTKNDVLGNILKLPVFKKMQYGIAASAIIALGFLGKQQYSEFEYEQQIELYNVENIEKYEKEVAKKMGFSEEYFSGKSNNFQMVDYINYESIRAAIEDQKGVDIGAY